MKDTDLIVVGAGYWGVAVAALAERNGFEVLLVDNAHVNGASRAASGYFAEGWYSGEWKGRMLRARAVAESCGVEIRNSGAHVYALKKPEPRYRQDWYTFSPGQVLNLRKPDATVEVEQVGSDFVQVDGERWKARGVVVAAGAWTDELLTRSGLPSLGVSHLAGTGVILEGAMPMGREVLLHEVTPYNQIAVRNWGPGEIRVCATQEKREGHTDEYVEKMMGRVRGYLGERKELRRLHGLRPLTKDGPVVKQVAASAVAMTGGGRIGGLMAFWAAEAALRLLGFAP